MAASQKIIKKNSFEILRLKSCQILMFEVEKFTSKHSTFGKLPFEIPQFVMSSDASIYAIL